ncbi:PfkB family carbohydrate kinase [Agrococcus sp. HG114]|uniref:PfkB family carbohydrate kinase n=1 Tax=Agrococcus sp. HG114 TaxID=2969757 RepID=UPI00215ACB8F|nr:PfkB family carbohydrate kinase [Agrococcus sp. HG114]MCR8671304.1 PfkB family carbohydrate kinase [Agrococcus sp. HG114]
MTEPVVVIGDALVDDIAGERHVGGAALNVAVGLARLDVPATLVAMVGDDDAGRLVRAHCERFGVGLAASPAPRGTAVATAVRDGDTMRYEFNAAGRSRFVDLAAAEPLLAAAPLVVVSCLALEHERQVAPLLALERSSERLLIDPNARPAYLEEPRARERFAAALDALAARALLVKLSDEDAELVYGEHADETAARLIAAGAGAVAVTRGPLGASILTSGGAVHAAVPALEAPIVDTIGAGDSVLASLTASVVAGEHRGGWAGPLERAMAVAAATTRAAGGLLQLPGSAR